MEYPEAGGEKGAFNLGTGRGYLARQAVELGDVTGWRVPVADAHRRPGDPPVLAAADKAERVLGWQPAYPDLATTVRHAWAWKRRWSSMARRSGAGSR